MDTIRQDLAYSLAQRLVGDLLLSELPLTANGIAVSSAACTPLSPCPAMLPLSPPGSDKTPVVCMVVPETMVCTTVGVQ